ncbi:MAG TPA: hypothetical protein PKD05_09315 [Candidatus Melainabacteria bacterium]|nr:hypothetical protein [Candidatus Melainabacteria bacterium]
MKSLYVGRNFMYYRKMTPNSINNQDKEPENASGTDSASASASVTAEGGSEVAGDIKVAGDTKELSGQVIGGRYKIEETIKDSRHTSVYRARHLLLDNRWQSKLCS